MRPETISRFIRQVEIAESGCWWWRGQTNDRGYPYFWAEGRCQRAHIWIYRQLRGPILRGKELHHECNTRHCVNPWCLKPVTHQENIRLRDQLRAARWNNGGTSHQLIFRTISSKTVERRHPGLATAIGATQPGS